MPSRRCVLGLAATIASTAGLIYWALDQDPWPDPGPIISAAEASAGVTAGQLVLIDIRKPEEWQQTGVPTGALRISMHQDTDNFVARVRAAALAAPDSQVALICHSGYRSSVMRAELERQGISRVLNVAEGVAGGRYGKGWAKGGLPLTKAGEAPRP